MNRRTASAAALMPWSTLASSTPVTDAIASAGIVSSWEYVTQRAKNNAGWLLILSRAGFPECLADACHSMQLYTLAQVDAFISRCGLSYAEVQGLFPRVSLDAGRTVTADELYLQGAMQFSVTKQAHGDFADYDMDHGAREYVTVTARGAADLAAAFPWRNAALSNKKQCEHLVTLFKGWCVQQGYADRAIGLAGFDMFSIGVFTIAHAVPFVYLDSGKFVLLDRGSVSPAGHAKFYGTPATTTYAKLRWLYI